MGLSKIIVLQELLSWIEKLSLPCANLVYTTVHARLSWRLGVGMAFLKGTNSLRGGMDRFCLGVNHPPGDYFERKSRDCPQRGHCDNLFGIYLFFRLAKFVCMHICVFLMLMQQIK